MEPLELSLPFLGRWLARNSPARRVPSHGTDVFGTRYAIDFVAVDDRRRTARKRSWRTLFATEPPDIFFGFGQPVLAPLGGVVVATHDGEVDHEARRSHFARVPYLLGQRRRMRQGVGGIAGNFLIISPPGSNAFVGIVHLQAGSLRVQVGDVVIDGQHVANCGNSGNSTQPHVHLQAMDSTDLSIASGMPIVFRSFREWARRKDRPQLRDGVVPNEGSVVEPMACR